MAPGRSLGGRYRLDAVLARGGMAEVWQATDQVLGRAVAVKILHPHLADDEGFRARFRSEAVSVARLVHPSIVAIYDTCNDDGTEAIVMELVRGRTLREFLDERGGRLDPVEVVHIGADVAAALTCAHRAGIVHRDMKPANILLSDDGRVLVTDFGIAKVLDQPDMTQTSTLLGTVKYLAPEQVEGAPVDARTDVYALGAVLYEALCGSPPFVGDNPAALALRRLQHDPPPLADRVRGVPPELDQAIRRALARRPDDRFARADDLRTALLAVRPEGDATVATHVDEGWATGASPATPPGPWDTVPATGPAPPAAGSRRPTAMVVSGVLVTLALVLVALLVARTDFGEDLLSRAPGAGPTAPSLVAVSGVTSFDPQGIGTPGEHEATVGNVIDAEPSTTWNTETYPNRAFGNLKTGVGIALTLPEARSLERIRVNSPSQDWAVEVYVSDAVAPTLAGWGEPIARADGVDGDVELDLGGATGAAVLVWITDLGTNDPLRVTVSDILLAG
nr:protein kinase [Rhabdothermincola salaria]